MMMGYWNPVLSVSPTPIRKPDPGSRLPVDVAVAVAVAIYHWLP